MKARLEVNGIDTNYPQPISSLENLILFVKAMADSEQKIISEVKVDGARFTEAYEHQAREIDLEEIANVKIRTLTKEAMAEVFLKMTPDLMGGLEVAFSSTSMLLRNPDREQNGYDMLARSLEAFYDLKSHLENVWTVLGKEDKLDECKVLWRNFNNLADMILKNQEKKNAAAIADLLEDRMMPFLKEWTEAIVSKDKGFHLGPAMKNTSTKQFEDMISGH